MNSTIFSPLKCYVLVIARVGTTGIDGSPNQSSFIFSLLEFNFISGSSYAIRGDSGTDDLSMEGQMASGRVLET
jgi:hypothetical protein